MIFINNWKKITVLIIGILIHGGTSLSQSNNPPLFESGEFNDLWSNQLKVLRDARVDVMAIESAKKSLMEFLLNNGMTQSDFLASIYTYEGMLLLNEGKTDSAIWALRSALEFDTGYFPAARGLFIASLKKSVSSCIFQLDEIARAYFKAFTNIWVILKFIGNICLIFTRASLITFFILILMLVLKIFPLWLHEFQEKFPEYASKKWLIAGLTGILAVPMIIGLGIIWTFMIWTILIYLYLSRRETVVLWLMIFTLFLIIPANIVRTAILKGYDESILPAISQAKYGGYSEGVITSLKNFQMLNPDDARSHFLIGILYKKGGKYFEALKEYLDYTRLVPEDANGHVNLGNIYFILNNHTEAVSEYRKAESLDVANAIIYYNLSKAYLHQFKFQQASDMLKKASSIDPDMVNYYTEIHSTNPNRLLADGDFPNHWIWQEVYGLLLSALAEQDQYWIRLGPGLNLTGTAVAFSIFLLVLAVLQTLRVKLKVGYFCLMCGQPACTNCQKDPEGYKYCSNCYSIFVKKTQVAAKQRDHVQTEMRTRHAMRWRIGMIGSLIFPGSGEFMLNNNFRGLFYSFTWALLLSAITMNAQRFFLTWSSPPVLESIETILISIVMLIVYGSSVFLVYRRRFE